MPSVRFAQLMKYGEPPTLEHLVFSTEYRAHRAVGEDLPDRVGEDIRTGHDDDVLRGAGPERDRVRHDNLLEARVRQPLERRAGENRVGARGVDARSNGV